MSCPHDPASPRQAAAYPDHGSVALSETAIMAAIATFFDQYMLGHDRAALLTAQLPATSAEHNQARARNQARLRAELARIDTAELGLITELETPADPGDPAARAYRARIRARFADLYAERTRTEATLAELAAAAPPDNDPSLLDPLPYAAGVFAQAPVRIQEALLTAFDIHALYRNDMHQVTIWASITDDTLRTDSDTSTATPGQNTFYHSAPAPMHGSRPTSMVALF